MLTISQIIFLYIAFILVLSSVMVVLSRNLVHGALWLLLALVHIAALFLILNAEFLFVVQLMVYAGGILVLYLFTITLMNVDKESIKNRFYGNAPIVMATALTTLLTFVIVALSKFTLPTADKYSVEYVKGIGGNVVAVGQSLFTTYLFPFEVASVVLLLAMVGAIILVKKNI